MGYWDRFRELRKSGLGFIQSLAMARKIGDMFPEGFVTFSKDSSNPQIVTLEIENFDGSSDLHTGLRKLGYRDRDFADPELRWVLIAEALVKAEEDGTLDMLIVNFTSHQSRAHIGPIVARHNGEIKDLVVKLGRLRNPAYTLHPEIEGYLRLSEVH